MQFDLGENWFTNNKLLWKVLNKKFSQTSQLLFLEVGSWKGRSAIWFIENFLHHPKSKLFCVDTWDMSLWNNLNTEKVLLETNKKRAEELKVSEIYEQFIYNLTYMGYLNKCDIIRMDSVKAASSLNDNYFDFIYIDGDHSETGCYNDLEAYWAKVKNGGILAGDDWKWKDDGEYPVQKAVKKFSLKNNLKVLPRFMHGNGYYFIKPASSNK